MIDLPDIIQGHINKTLAQMYTTMPAKVEKVYKVENSTVVDVQPLLNITSAGGVLKENILQEVPIVWPSGGGFRITCPIEVGDNVLLHFSMKGLSGWKNSQGKQPTTDTYKRRFNKNDAFAVPSIHPFSEGKEVDNEAMSLGSDTVEIRITKEGTIELGEGASEKLILGDTFINNFLAHTHTYVDSVGTAATPTPKLTMGVGAVLSTPDTPADWEDSLSEVSKTL